MSPYIIRQRISARGFYDCINFTQSLRLLLNSCLRYLGLRHLSLFCPVKLGFIHTALSPYSTTTFRLGIAGILCSLFALFSVLFAPRAATAESRYGLWVEVEAEGRPQPFRSRAELDQLLEMLATQPFTDVYCQVYRGGRSWFPSSLADPTPFDNALAFGADPLREVLDTAHARGIRVHAWINALRIDRNTEAPILKVLGDDIVLVDHTNSSLLKSRNPKGPPRYLGLDAPGIWLDPSVLGVRNYLTALTKELLRSYPDLDGVHLDMIRFPFSYKGPLMKFPYGSDASRRFQAKGGFAPPKDKRNKVEWERWTSWRKEQVTDLVVALRSALHSFGKEKELSAAVIGWPDRAEEAALQEWPRWIAEGEIDSVVLMNYTKDLKVFEKNLAHAILTRRRVGSNSKIIAGIGAWLFLKDSATNYRRLLQQIEISESMGAEGAVLFSYANLASPKGAALLAAIRAERKR